ncbi:MAG: dihydrodipicolinate synthase family protein [Planctomycetes bacterium]|nr:dihydrodipicolinate synthase family protein [Planctomycetota bacterium]
MKISDIPLQIRENVKRGTVIPAHPMVLDADKNFDVRQQSALTRYYLDAGVGGIAIGVHTTQFEIRDPKYGLFAPVLTLASETVDDYCAKSGRSILKIAGVCGNTEQAVEEATFACETGFHACLLNLGGLKEENISELIVHCRAVADVMPIFGFYLQPIAGGRLLPFNFWKQFAEIDNILAIKIAPFNRYQTLDVVRAVCEAGKEKDIALYTGNDDSIVLDLLCEYKIETADGTKTVRIVGGLLGHWAVWTKKAVEMLEILHSITEKNAPVPAEILQLAGQVTDANAVLFDAANDFSGCIPGIHEVLRRQGLMKGIWCLDANQALSPGQSGEFDRIYRAYPEMNDDSFIKENLDRWLQD